MSKKWPRSRRQKISHAFVYAGFACFLCAFVSIVIHMFIVESDIVIGGQPLSHLSGVAHNEDHLYLMYDDVPMVRVYDLDGEFQFDLRPGEISPSYGGWVSMIADGHDLYLYTREKDVYLWTNDVYVQSWKDEAGLEKWYELKERYAEPHPVAANRYEVRNEDVWRVYEDGTAENVINLPWIFRTLNPTVMVLGPFVLVELGVICFLISSKIRW